MLPSLKEIQQVIMCVLYSPQLYYFDLILFTGVIVSAWSHTVLWHFSNCSNWWNNVCHIVYGKLFNPSLLINISTEWAAPPTCLKHKKRQGTCDCNNHIHADP